MSSVCEFWDKNSFYKSYCQNKKTTQHTIRLLWLKQQGWGHREHYSWVWNSHTKEEEGQHYEHSRGWQAPACPVLPSPTATQEYVQGTGTQSPSKPNCVGRTSIHILEANCIRLNCEEDWIPITLFPVSGRLSPQKASEVGRGRRNGGPRLTCPDPRCSLSMLLLVSVCLPLWIVYLISTFPFSTTEMSSDSWLTLLVPQCDFSPSSAKSQDCYSWIWRECERTHVLCL